MGVEYRQLYKCDLCGNIVIVVHPGGGDLVCCGQPMKLLVENTVDASKEKHVPVIEKTAKGYLVKVGGVPHPMEEKHWIEWIELEVDGMVHIKPLGPGMAPEAEFCCAHGGKVKAREYCNIHGLWSATA